MPRRARWTREDFALKADALAPALLGQRLVRVSASGARLAGSIVETEAYLGVEDRASHAFGGRRSARNESMYGLPGLVYVYFTYGMHHCVNVVCGEAGDPAAVLIRAVEPVEGLELMRQARVRERAPSPARPIGDREIASGPGRLCQAMGIGRDLDGAHLATSRSIWIEREPESNCPPRRGPRIGLGQVGEWRKRRLRYWIPDSVWVSR